MSAADPVEPDTGPPPSHGRPRSRRRGVIALVAAAAVLAAVVSVVLATRSGAGDSTGGRCPVQALTCAPGQSDPADSASPTAPPAGDGARTSGVERTTPARHPAPGQDPAAGGS